MQDLEEKLKALDLEFLHGVPVHLTNDMVEAIKQAFIDAEWLTPEQAKEITNVKRHLKGCMTGQEFYDRFERELMLLLNCEVDDYPKWVGDIKTVNLIYAARKAAGLES